MLVQSMAQRICFGSPRTCCPTRAPKAFTRHRVTGLALVCGKGFSTGNKSKGSGRAKDVGKSIKESVRPSGARPVDPEEAARGKVDFVQVKDWGPAKVPPGTTPDLGELKLDDGAATMMDPGLAAPLYELLARRLQVLDSQGALKIADSGKPWPPVPQWSFNLPRYQQYLLDMLEVHTSLEHTIQTSLVAVGAVAADPAPYSQVGTSSASSSKDSSSSSSSSSGEDDSASLEQQCSSSAGGLSGSQGGKGPAASLAYFGPELQLQRAAAISRDINALERSHGREADTSPPGEAREAQEPAGDSLSSNSRRIGASREGPGLGAGLGPKQGGLPTRPTSTAVAYAKYLAQLGKGAAAAAADGDVAEEVVALLRLLANAYSVYVVHQAFGVRVGAAAAEKLQLFQSQAVAFYKDYPGGVEDPQGRLQDSVDAAGRCLAAHEVEVVLQELPKAYTKNALLIGTLAQRD